MRTNPIIKKELMLGARSIKLPIALMFYSGTMAAISMLILMSSTHFSEIESGYYWGRNLVDFDGLVTGFIALAIIQLVMICIIIPELTASSIAGERERQTLDIMLTAPISPFSIVMGKLGASICNVFLFVVSSLPAMAIPFLYGGIQWGYLGVFMIAMMCIAFFTGAIGVWCSSVYKKTIVAIIMTMVVEVLFYVGTISVVIAAYYYKYTQIMQTGGVIGISGIQLGWIPVVLLLNPAIGFVDAIYGSCSGESIIRGLFGGSFFGRMNIASGMEKLLPYWSWLSMGMAVLMGFGFVFLAARRIDAVRRKEKRIKLSKKDKKK